MSNLKNVEIIFCPEGSNETKSILAQPGELLTQVALRANVTIQQSCGGSPSCADCKVKVLENQEDAFESVQGPEERLLGNIYHITHERLACQAVVKGASKILVPDAKRLNDEAQARKKNWQSKPRKKRPL